jgi:hypothetical protein
VISNCFTVCEDFEARLRIECIRKRGKYGGGEDIEGGGGNKGGIGKRWDGLPDRSMDNVNFCVLNVLC